MGKALLTFLTLTEVWLVALGLAAFLTLFWVLRGAPVGQAVEQEEDEDAPQSGYRDRVAAAVCVGMLLILFGAYLALSRGIPWSLPAFALGFGTVISLGLINQRFRHGSPSLRRTVDLSTAALNASLFAGILIVVNVIAFRYGGRALDLTQEQAFSLASLTVAQVKTLEVPVTFTTFFGRSAIAAQQFDRVQQLLDLYRAVNPEKVKLDHVDPFRDLPRYEALVKRVPEIDVTQGGGVLIEYGEGKTAQHIVVRNADLFEVPRAGRFDPEAEKFESTFKGEDAITTALIRLREGKKPKIVFTTGHGEPSIDDMETNRSGVGLWRSRLTSTGMDVFAVNLLTEEVPADVALVVIDGPKTPFKPDEVTRLKAYADRKGPLLVLVGDTASTGLEDFLKGVDVEIGKGFVVEPKANYRSRVEAILVPVVGRPHPILDPLGNEVVFLVRAAPLKIAKQAKAAATVASPLLKTTPQSWVEPDLAAVRVQRGVDAESGPVNVGVAVNDRGNQGDPKPGAPRLVVFSSRYMADNAMLQLAPSNLDLLMNAVNWLRGRDDLQGIAPKVHDALTLNADPLVRARLILVPTVMAVLLIITLGVVTYIARRD